MSDSKTTLTLPKLAPLTDAEARALYVAAVRVKNGRGAEVRVERSGNGLRIIALSSP